MKKLLTMALAFAMAASLTLGIAACSITPVGSNENNPDSGNTQTGGSGEQSGDGTQTEELSVAVEKFVSDRLPEDNVEAALLEAFSYLGEKNIKIESRLQFSTGPFAEESVTRVNDLEHWMSAGREGTLGDYLELLTWEKGEQFYDFSVDPPVCYRRKDGEEVFTRETAQGKSLDEYLSLGPDVEYEYSIVLQLLSLEDAERISQLKYSTKYRGYIYEESSEESGKNIIVIKIKDGKLACVYAKTIFPDSFGKDLEVAYYWRITYGGQTVTLPTVEE